MFSNSRVLVFINAMKKMSVNIANDSWKRYSNFLSLIFFVKCLFVLVAQNHHLYSLFYTLTSTWCSIASELLSASNWRPVICCWSSSTNDLYCSTSISFAARTACTNEREEWIKRARMCVHRRHGLQIGLRFPRSVTNRRWGSKAHAWKLTGCGNLVL